MAINTQPTQPEFQFVEPKIELYGEFSISDISAIIREELATYVHRRTFSTVDDTTDYIHAALVGEKSERFCVLWLDTRHRFLGFETMFKGTIDGASVHTRELVKRGLQLNAAACVLAHNHPSGTPEPSMQDIRITARIKEALSLIDIRVLDHIIVAGADTISLADRGQM